MNPANKAPLCGEMQSSSNNDNRKSSNYHNSASKQLVIPNNINSSSICSSFKSSNSLINYNQNFNPSTSASMNNINIPNILNNITSNQLSIPNNTNSSSIYSSLISSSMSNSNVSNLSTNNNYQSTNYINNQSTNPITNIYNLPVISNKSTREYNQFNQPTSYKNKKVRRDIRAYKKVFTKFDDLGYTSMIDKIIKEDILPERINISTTVDMNFGSDLEVAIEDANEVGNQLAILNEEVEVAIGARDANEGVDCFVSSEIEDNDNSDYFVDDDNLNFEKYDSDHDIASDLAAVNVVSEYVYSRPSEYENFNIIDYANEFYANKLKKNKVSNDQNVVVFSNDCPYTLNEVVKKFKYLIASNNLNDEVVKNLFSLLSDILPNAAWPIKKTENNIVHVKLEENDIEDYRTIHIDICPNFCLSYAGNYKSLFSCAKCEAPRYSKCKVCSEPLECEHRWARVSIRKVWYRPLLLLIHDLLESDHFLNAIKYNCESDTKYFRSDIRTGSNFKKHYAEMCQKFDAKNDCSLIMVNLLISEFYDGIQLFKSKIQNFWPLMISILNLPLSMRIKSGVGTFLISLYTGKLNTATERFILEECLVEELRGFYEGIIIHKNEKKYFVQIRLISTVLDTKGFEETIHVQGTGSYAGCFLCNIGRGFQMGVKSKHVPILGHRVALELDHILRNLGQSEDCCPVNYYSYNESNVVKENLVNDFDDDNSSVSNLDDENDLDESICKVVGTFNFKVLKTINDYKNRLKCLTLKDYQYNSLLTYMSSNNEWKWYHGYNEKKFKYLYK